MGQITATPMPVIVRSGAYVIADVEVEVSSGLWVDGISGVHVFVESGVHVVTEAEITVDISGDSIIISGQPIDVSGSHVWISGQHIFVESGVYLASGIHVVSASGSMHAFIDGGTITVDSGAYVVVESGLGVVGGATPTSMSGAYDATATEIITDSIRVLTAGSGGEVLHSGNILAVEIKALTDNTCDIYIGGVNYRPYSGFGYPLSAGEIKDIEINTLDAVYLFGACSGDMVGWMAVV